MNIVAGPKRQHGEGGLGVECSGVVTRVGPDVKDLAIGDRVITMSPGSFATRLTTREDLCAKIPDNLGFTEAATIPCVYGTVIYSLMDVARLERGQVSLMKEYKREEALLTVVTYRPFSSTPAPAEWVSLRSK